MASNAKLIAILNAACAGDCLVKETNAYGDISFFKILLITDKNVAYTEGDAKTGKADPRAEEAFMSIEDFLDETVELSLVSHPGTVFMKVSEKGSIVTVSDKPFHDANLSLTFVNGELIASEVIFLPAE